MENFKEWCMISELKRCMQSKGMTQKELAKKAGIGGSTLSLFFNGKLNLTVRNYAKLVQALGVTVKLDDDRETLERRIDILQATLDNLTRYVNEISGSLTNERKTEYDY